MEGNPAGPTTPYPPSVGGSFCGRWVGADRGSASSVDMDPDSPAASTLGHTNVLSEVRSDKETSPGSTSSPHL